MSSFVLLHADVQFPSRVLKGLVFPGEWSWTPWLESLDCIREGLFLASLVFAAGLCVRLYADIYADTTVLMTVAL